MFKSKFQKKLVLVIIIIIVLGTTVAAALFQPLNNIADFSILNNTNSISFKDIKDIYNRTVTIPSDVKSISIVGSATRIGVYAGAEDKIISVTDMEKPSIYRPYTIAQEDKFNNLPSTNNGNHLNTTTIDKEKIIELNPDVIISSRNSNECNDLQTETGIPVIGVFYQNELFSNKVFDSINIFGEVAGTTKKSNELVNFLKKCQNDLSNRAPIENNAKIYRGAVNYKGSKGITGTISDYDVYKAINVKSLSDNKTIANSYDTTFEQLLSWNPEYIFLDYANKDKVENEYESNKDACAQISAFKNNNIYYVSSFNNNGTNLEYGLCEAYYTATILYKDAFSDIDFEKKCSEIFKAFYHKDISNKLKEKGLFFGQATF